MEHAARYLRNLDTLTPAQQDQLGKARVCVVGCGGLGGYVIEYLGRLGFGWITAVDGDRFEETNLNRQLYSLTENLGTSKALGAKARMAQVNPLVHVEAVEQFLTEENAARILAGHDVVIDCLDGIGARLMLQEACARLGIPLVHGAVEGWGAQVCVVMPGDQSLSKLYPANGAASGLGTLSFVAGYAAALEVGQAVNLLLGTGEVLRRKVLFADLCSCRMDILPL